MPLGPILAAVAPTVISAVASAGASKLFGGGSSSAINSDPSNVNAGGLTSTFKNGTASVTSSALRSGLVGRVASTFPDQARLLGGLRASVAPGMSALRAARLAELEANRRNATGDLRDNLARRRVLGSSFAQDSLARTDLAFAQQKDAIEADSFLQELQLTQQLTQAEFEARRGEFQTSLDEMNLEANLATQLASGATAQLGANARLKAQLDSQSAAGAGKFFGDIGAKLGTALGSVGGVPTSASLGQPVPANPFGFS